MSIHGPGYLADEEWNLMEIGFNGKEPTITDLFIPKSSYIIPLHIVLNCRCDTKPIDIVLPYNSNGLDINAAIISGPQGVTLSKETY